MNPLKPKKEFRSSVELKDFMDNSNENWEGVKDFEEVFPDLECFRSGSGELLTVPLSNNANLRETAKLYSNFGTFKREILDLEEFKGPFMVVFDIFSENTGVLEHLWKESSEFGSGSGSSSLAGAVLKADSWLYDLFISGRGHLAFADAKFFALLCSLAGEAIRAEKSGDLFWSVEGVQIAELGLVLTANLMSHDGVRTEIALPLSKHLADPDYGTLRSILSTFVEMHS